MPSAGRQILLLGHRSFAAQGLSAVLAARGHSITNFSRGTVGRRGCTVSGPVDRVHASPDLAAQYDTVINYILLADRDTSANEAFLSSLLRLCVEKKVEHLIHISSMSVYRTDLTLVNESAEVETIPGRKGGYGSLKVAQDEYLKKELPNSVKLTLLRPGFILGSGLPDPMIGSGFRAPWNVVLAIGDVKRRIPLTTRGLVNRAVEEIVDSPPRTSPEVVLLADASSPTKREYLDACCRELGCGSRTVAFPKGLWLASAVIAEVGSRLIGRGGWKVYQRVRSVCQAQQFDSSESERRLGFRLSVDWQSELKKAMESQLPNFELTTQPTDSLRPIEIERITYIGFGRVVRLRHLSALNRLGFSGTVEAYDVGTPPAGLQAGVKMIDRKGISSSDLFVVATPGPAHIQALDLLSSLEGKILVEKPLCYSQKELLRLASFDESQPRRLFVCHNYRLKKNVLDMVTHLSRFNPGRLLHVSVSFQSPPVEKDDVTWLTNEREARTLLMDYSIHYLDLACMFGYGPWKVDCIRHETNAKGATSLIDGRVSCETYSVSLVLRQGFIPRKASVEFTFQNYGVSLRFFPDVFLPQMASDNYWLHKRESRALWRGTLVKAVDKLFSRDSDPSHAHVYLSVLDDLSASGNGLSFKRVKAFYELLFKLSDLVYGTRHLPKTRGGAPPSD